MRLTDSKMMRDADSSAIHVSGVPSTWLMTNAAGHVARAAMDLMDVKRRAVIFCGSGNNGGDGVAAALYLLRRGVELRVILVGSRERLTDDTAEMERRLTELGAILEDFSELDIEDLERFIKSSGVIIDAILGIGLDREISGDVLYAVNLINAAEAPVVSADIASGVQADTGRILGNAVHADVTVTFTKAKAGHFVEPGCTCCGELKIVDIGIPKELADGAEINIHAVMPEDVALPKRNPISHKGDYGKLLLIGGSVGYTGAPTLAARAAVRAGAGLVSLGVPASIYQITAVKNDEAMPFPLADRDGRLSIDALPVILDKLASCDVCAIGMGLGRSEELNGLVQNLVAESNKPLIIDADGLFALAQDMTALERAKKPIILTPHEGEFIRMGGDLTGGRLGAAREFAEKHGCVLLLKGHHSICAFPDGEVCIIPNGSPGMAKGGSGDVLSGIIAAMMGQLPLKRAVITAAYLHARAGEICAEKYGEYAMTPGDIIENLCNVDIMKGIEGK